MAPPHILKDAANVASERTGALIERTADVFGPEDPEVTISIAGGVMMTAMGALGAALAVNYPEHEPEELLREYVDKAVPAIAKLLASVRKEAAQ